MSERKLYRSRENRVLAGVCGGIGEYFDVDPSIIRIIFVLFAIWGGIGIILYIIGLIIMPERADKKEESFSNVAPPIGKKKEIDEEETDYDYHGHHRHKSSEYVVGVLIILLGLFFLFRNFMPWLSFQFFWPMLLIFIGLLLLFSNVKKGEK